MLGGVIHLGEGEKFILGYQYVEWRCSFVEGYYVEWEESIGVTFCDLVVETWARECAGQLNAYQ